MYIMYIYIYIYAFETTSRAISIITHTVLRKNAFNAERFAL